MEKYIHVFLKCKFPLLARFEWLFYVFGRKNRVQLDFGVGPLIFLMRKIFRMSLQKMVLYAAMKMFTLYITIFSLANIGWPSEGSLRSPRRRLLQQSYTRLTASADGLASRRFSFSWSLLLIDY